MYIKVSSYWPEAQSAFIGPMPEAAAINQCLLAITESETTVWSHQTARDLRAGLKLTIITNRAAKSRICNEAPNCNVIGAIPSNASELTRWLRELNEL